MKYKRLLLCVSLVIAGVYTGNAALVTYGTQVYSFERGVNGNVDSL